MPWHARATSCSSSSTTKQEYIPQTADADQTVLPTEAEQGIFRYQTAAGEQRTANLLQIAGAERLPVHDRSDHRRRAREQHEARQYGSVEPGNNLRTEMLTWLEPQKTDQLLSDGATRLSDHAEPVLDGQLEPAIDQDAQGRRGWPIPGYPHQLDTFDAGWWVASTGLNWTIDSNMHNEFRYGIQHSGDTNAVAARRSIYELNGIVNGLPARFDAAARPRHRSQRRRADHRPALHHDDLRHVDDDPRQSQLKFGGKFRETHWRDHVVRRRRARAGYPRPAAVHARLADRRSGPVASSTPTTMPGIQNADLANVLQRSTHC